jgi:hypothetical protein
VRCIGLKLGCWLLAAAAVLAGHAPAAAAVQRAVRAIDPPSVMQGDTAALTITGENLPTGGVVVEFFPQQLAVLKVLSATDREVVVQVKVPSLAPPGVYNVVVYNQLGDEAFGSGLLTIGSGLVTPVFRDFDPKVIAEASNGFAVMLTGDSITPAVIGHLSMQWLLGEQRLGALKSTFGMGGSGTVVCAVSGKPPPGTLRGKLYMDEKLIYLVDLQVQGPGLAIIGHSPAQLPVNQASYEIRILGANLDQSLVALLTVTLESASTVSKATSITLADAASVQVAFAAPLPAGEYTLVVKQGASVTYTGVVTLTPGAAPSSGTLQPPASTVVGQGNPTAPASAAPAAGKARIASVTPLTIPAGSAPCRFACQGEGLSGNLVEQLSAMLVLDGAAANLLFVGVQHSSLTCVFAAPEGGWRAGQTGKLSISDAQGLIEPFSADMLVGAAAPEAQASAPQPAVPAGRLLEAPAPPAAVPASDGLAEPRSAAAGVWRATSAYITAGQGTATLCVTADPPQPTWDPALLKGSFTLLPADPAAAAAFSNLILEGELAFRRSDAGAPVGEFTGNFVAGELLVKLSYGGSVPEVSVIGLDCPLPKASFVPPAVEKLQRGTAPGQLLPETLRFVADFAPFVVQDTSFLTPVCTPPVDTANAYQLSATGTQVEIIVQTRAWDGVRDWSSGFSFELSSRVKLDWATEPKQHISVDAALEQPAVTVSIAQLPAPIDGKGFNITVLPSSSDIPVAEWGKVRASSSNPLLDPNLGQFQVSATSAELLGQQCIRLRFRRDPALLSDAAYSLLRDELLSAGPVSLKLEWLSLGCSAQGELKFTDAPQGALGELFDDVKPTSGER